MRRFLFAVGISLALGGVVAAQAPESTVPRRVPFSGQVSDAEGRPLTGLTTLIFALYEDQTGGAPIWVEIQVVESDRNGRYSVLLGETTEGLPIDLFTNGAARWLGVTPTGQDELSRVRLVAVPYAIKAADAETLGGKSLSQFLLVDSPEGQASAAAARGERTSGSEVSTNLQTINDDLRVNGDAVIDGVLDLLWQGSAGTPAMGHAFLWHKSNTDAIEFKFANGQTPLLVDNNTGVRVMGNTASGTGLILDGVLDVTWGPAPPAPAAGHALMWLNSATGALGFKFSNGTTPLLIDNDTGVRVNGDVGAGRGLLIDGVLDLLWGPAPPAPAAGHALLWHNSANSALEFKFSNGATPLKVKKDGSITVSGDASFGGDVTVSGNIAAKYQDVAEWVDAAEPLESGTVVVIDASSMNVVRAAATPYDTAVAGAVSAQPGLILGDAGPGRILVAQSGRVRIKVDATYGAIRAGDLLVTSPTPGHAMRSEPVTLGDTLLHRPGTILGKALEPLSHGKGEILVLLTLQ